jgi:hypothetical protein
MFYRINTYVTFIVGVMVIYLHVSVVWNPRILRKIGHVSHGYSSWYWSICMVCLCHLCGSMFRYWGKIPMLLCEDRITLRKDRLCAAHLIETNSLSLYETTFHNHRRRQLIKCLLQSHGCPITGQHHLMLWHAFTMDVSTRTDRTSHPTRLEWKLAAPTSVSNANARYLFF